MTRLCSLAALVVLTGPLVSSAAAQAADAHWMPWLGCWKSADDVAGTGARVCVAPADGGVTLTTVLGGQRVSQHARIADGRPHPVEADGCTGTETARWAADGRRMYRTATVACGGADARTLQTAAFLVQGPVWVDVETVTQDGSAHVRVSRLVPAPAVVLADGTTFTSASRATAADRLTRWAVDDVIDLSTALPPDGVQAAIAEAPAPFALNARALTALADAGVGDRVIDLMVGLTYPAHFTITRAVAGSAGGPGGFGMPLADPFFAPILGPAALFNCFGGFSWAMPAYWSSCAAFDPYYASRYPGYYSGYWGAYGPGWVQINAGDVGGGGSPPAVEARLVNHRGYTQVQPVDTSFTAGGTNGSFSGASAGNGSSSGGSVSGSGYSGGGAVSGGGDRMAVPRGPGGA